MISLSVCTPKPHANSPIAGHDGSVVDPSSRTTANLPKPEAFTSKTPLIFRLILEFSDVIMNLLQLGDHLILQVLEVNVIGFLPHSVLDRLQALFDLIQMSFVH